MRQDERIQRAQRLRSVAHKVAARDVAALLNQYADEMACGTEAPVRAGDGQVARLA